MTTDDYTAMRLADHKRQTEAWLRQQANTDRYHTRDPITKDIIYDPIVSRMSVGVGGAVGRAVGLNSCRRPH